MLRGEKEGGSETSMVLQIIPATTEHRRKNAFSDKNVNL